MGRFLKRMKAKRKARADMRDRLMNERMRMKEDVKLRKIRRRFNKNRGKIDTGEEVELSEYTPAMAEQLQEQGIELENPNDTTEVAARYNAEILENEDVPQDDYDKAYILGDDSFESYEEHIEERSKARNRIRSILGVIGGAIKGGIEVAREKKKSGEPLSRADMLVLDMDKETRDYGKKQAGIELKKFALPVMVILIIYLIASR